MKILISTEPLNENNKISTNLAKKNKINKNKRKYLDPLNDFRLINENRPSGSRKKIKQIENGNLYPAKDNDDKIYVFENTSHIDSIFQTFVHAYTNIKSFKKFCDSVEIQKEEFFNLLTRYCEKFNTKLYYQKRLEILLQIGEVKNDFISCTNNAGFYFSKLCGTLAGISRTLYCTSCKKNMGESRHNTLEFSSMHLEIIKEYIEKPNFVTCLFNSQNLICGGCHSALEITYDYGEWILINLEDIDLTINIYNLHSSFVLKKKTFILIGVIEVCQSTNSPHKKYTSICRDLSGYWSRKEPGVGKFNKRQPKINLKPALIIYINSTNDNN